MKLDAWKGGDLAQAGGTIRGQSLRMACIVAIPLPVLGDCSRYDVLMATAPYQTKAYRRAKVAFKGLPCRWCGLPSDSVDHIRPLSRGGLASRLSAGPSSLTGPEAIGTSQNINKNIGVVKGDFQYFVSIQGPGH